MAIFCLSTITDVKYPLLLLLEAFPLQRKDEERPVSSEQLKYLHVNSVCLIYYFYDALFKYQLANVVFVQFVNSGDFFFYPPLPLHQLAFIFSCPASLQEIAIQQSKAEVRAGQCGQLRTPELIAYARREHVHPSQPGHAAAFKHSQARKQQCKSLPQKTVLVCTLGVHYFCDASLQLQFLPLLLDLLLTDPVAWKQWLLWHAQVGAQALI